MRATIALDRNTGAILKINGQISAIRASRNISTPGLPNQGTPFSVDANGDATREMQEVQDLSAMAWNFTKAAGTIVNEIDTEVCIVALFPFFVWVLKPITLQDELKLLRLRTKKQELVIVPDSKFLLLVVHDTPPA